MKLKKNEDQSVDTTPLLRIWNRTPMEEVTETKFGAQSKRWTIQRLPHLGVHSIISHQIQTLFHTPARFCWKDPDIAVSCEAMPVHTEVDAHSHPLAEIRRHFSRWWLRKMRKAWWCSPLHALGYFCAFQGNSKAPWSLKIKMKF